MTMLDAIMDGLTNNENGALRELCAAAACEFLVWSQKHQPVKKSGTGSGGHQPLHCHQTGQLGRTSLGSFMPRFHSSAAVHRCASICAALLPGR